MTRYFLDTNTCIYIIKKSPKKVFEKLKTLKLHDVAVSSITFCELQYGISNSSRPTENQEALREFLAPLEILDFPAACAPLYGEVNAQLKKKGTPIGPLDLLIGIHAGHENATLVTNNVREFKRIPGLKVQNWA